MEVKKCTKCSEIQPVSEFTFDKNRFDLLDPWCKSCKRKHKESYYHSEIGVVTQIYVHQKQSCKKRRHAMPEYSKAELKNWLFEKPYFFELFNQWKDSGFYRWLSPSVDRIDDSKSYTIDNIQLMSWKENDAKWRIQLANGEVVGSARPVIKTNKITGESIRYNSVLSAGKDTGLSTRTIRDYCLNRRKPLLDKCNTWSYEH